ncbi:CheR family methyltransferase [Lentzea flava]|uniref:protein-glutamate O-methyltransferase n=1 Tax=Lentzea flava TaxID=103732 RepID=A0ABQ2UGY8_9PSEU|nr:CheR family methyltransferase [Lentzea flava]MCP2199221.1 two-component system, chemotaxis family, CheB/CheR fusion protein [Lentzea flava]GGU33674.1 chemotaxis protein CheR [Lentzea flava]
MSDGQPIPDQDFEEVLQYLKESRGFDFTGYKRTSLMRRVRHRMSQIGVDDYTDYIDQLQVNADEFSVLFNTILINVTAFFRDQEAWTYLREEVIPTLLAERGPDDPIRVWSAGCASGEEAYSLAIALAEAMGPERFRQQVKIYATDVDDEALSHARHASYAERDLQSMPPELATKYFEQQNGRYSFRKDLRRSVIFGRNDLVQDAPISRIDLLVCRNTLMYFNQETQAKILGRFHFALMPKGVLFLGKAEMLLSHSRIFDPIDLKRRLFRKAASGAGTPAHFVSHAMVHDRRVDLRGIDALREHAFSASPVAQIVVTAEDVVALINQQAENTFGLSAKDVGRPLRDIDISYRPVELRGYVDQARLERKSLRIKDVEWLRGPGESTWFEVHVNPLVGADNAILGVSVVFHDMTAARRLLEDLEHANRQLESAYEELQSTNEELETTNEELQSTVEELETTNEELQSTNEELETMNEELQSTNDELQTINDALRERTTELDRVNEFLESILTSLRAGVIVLDVQMRVLAWNRGAEELWGMRRDEAEGEHLLNLDIGLPVADLRPVVRSALSDGTFMEEVKLTAVNRRGREVLIRVVCSSLRANGGEPDGAILVMEQQED